MTNPVFIKEHVITNNKNAVVFKEKMLNGFNVVTSLIDNESQASSIYQTFAEVGEEEKLNDEVKKEAAHPNSWDSISPASVVRAPYHTPIASSLIGVNARLISHVMRPLLPTQVTVSPYSNNSYNHSYVENRELINTIKKVFDVTAVVIRGSDGKLHNADSVAYIECCKILFKYARGTFIINRDAVFNNDDIKPIGTVIELPEAQEPTICNSKWPFEPEVVVKALTSALLSNEKVDDLIFLGVDPYKITTVSNIIEISTEWAANGEDCAVELHDHVPVTTVYDKVFYQNKEKLVRYTEYVERTGMVVNKFF